jgi:hypothetical protein
MVAFLQYVFKKRGLDSDILVRIRMRIQILGSIPLVNGSGCGHKTVPVAFMVFVTIFV